MAQICHASLRELSSKTILLTGASGQLGRYLLRLLNGLNGLYDLGIRVYCVNRRRFEYSQVSRLKHLEIIELVGSVSDGILNQVKYFPDIIIHGASPSSVSASKFDYLDANVFCGKSLLDMSVKWNTKTCIFLSSSAVYGGKAAHAICEGRDSIFINDKSSSYALAKIAGEELFDSYSEKYGLKTMVLRLHQVYGLEFILNNRHSILSRLLHEYHLGRDLALLNPSKVVTFCHVRDSLAAILLIIIKGRDREVYDVADRFSCLSLAELKSIVYEKKTSFIDRPIAALTTLEKLGWVPAMNLEANISKISSKLREIMAFGVDVV